ncbi:MAG: NusG domain II-containing protein [Spirochaetales bacterium]|nr:NusG domain II-containing protein [Spirochaetales bacterium]
MKLLQRIRLKALDLVIFAAAAILVAAASFTVFRQQQGTLYARISGENGEWMAPLDQEAVYQIPGPLGITYVHIHDGMACIEKSPCPNQLCVASGSISQANQWVACLPNNVFVTIVGGDGSVEAGLDAAVY